MNSPTIIYQEKKIIAFLVVLVFVLLATYVYLINSSILNVVIRKEAEELIAVTETENSSLVALYLRLSQAIDTDLATELNLISIKSNDVIAIKRPKTATVSLFSNDL